MRGKLRMATMPPLVAATAQTDRVPATPPSTQKSQAAVASRASPRTILSQNIHRPARGIRTTGEVTPHHLVLTDDAVVSLDPSRHKMNPPLRDRAHQEVLWWGLDQGVVDVLGSDHAPHTLDEKSGSYPATPSGMPGVQTLVPVMLDHVAQGRLTLERFVDLTSAGPQRIFGIARKGRIALGYDADFTIVDLKRRETITNDWIATKAGWTPYDGRSVTGWPVGTIVRGIRVMWQGELVNPGQGAPIAFLEAWQPAG